MAASASGKTIMKNNKMIITRSQDSGYVQG